MADKRSSEVINLPVIDLKEGLLVGKVLSVIVDSINRKILGLEVKGKAFLKSKLYFLPINNVKRIGPDAITIIDATYLVEKDNDPQLSLASQGDLVGKKLVSEDGDLVGSVDNFSFDEKGDLISLYLSESRGDKFFKGENVLPVSSITNIGKDFIVVKSDYATYLERGETATYEHIKSKGIELSHSLEVKAIEYALNKTTKQNIYNTNGDVLIPKGEKVTPDTIDKARENGRLPHLLIAAGVGEFLDALDKPMEKLDSGSKKLLDFWYKIKRKAFTERESDAEDTNGNAKESFENDKAKENDNANENEIEDFLSQLHTLGKVTAEKIEETSKEKIQQFLLNKTARERVVAPTGEVLAEVGQVIDTNIIARGEALGLLSQLFASVFRGEVNSHMNHFRKVLMDIFESKSP